MNAKKSDPLFLLRGRSQCATLFVSVAAVTILSWPLLPAKICLADDQWTTSTGNWNTPGNWSAGVPSSGASATISNSNGASRTVTYNYTGAPVSLATFTLDLTGGSGSATNTLSMSANNLTVNQIEEIGVNGVGSFNQSGGINSVAFLDLGYNTGAAGAYNLSGTGVLTSQGEGIGLAGMGTFTQSGGTNIVASPAGGSLFVGSNIGGNGSYNLLGGTLSAGVEGIGVQAQAGQFTQTGGTNTINSELIVGETHGTTGTYNLSGAAILTLSNGYEEVGIFGAGTFTQTGGTNVIDSGSLGIGITSGSTGSYTLSGGTFSAPAIYVGGGYAIEVGGGTVVTSGGQGTFSVSGTGSASVAGTLKVFNTGGNSLNLSGGSINTGSLDLSGNLGLLNWTGGTLNLTNSSVILDDSASAWNGFSSLTLNAGMALEVALPETVGFSGTGALTVAGGRNTAGSSGLFIGYAGGSQGTCTISGNGILASFGGETIGSSGTALLNQYNGQNSIYSGNLSLGVAAGSSGTYLLSGGGLSAGPTYVGGSSSGPGGTGVLTLSGGASLTSYDAITVYNTPGTAFTNNGGSVNATALNVSGQFAQSAGSSTFGHITGGGAATLSGGQLLLSDDTSGSLAALTVTGPVTFGFNIGTASASQIVATSATFTAMPNLLFTVSGYPEAGTIFTLISGDSFSDNGTLTSLPTQAVTIGRNTLTPSFTGGSGGLGAIILTVAGGPARLSWIGNSSSTWDTQATANWNNHTTPALTPDTFYAGDHVTFDDTASSFVVNINNGDVISNAVTFNNAANPYTVNGPYAIAGSSSVTFTGSNSVTLNNYNTYTGTTTLSGGGMVILNGGLASPAINILHGTLQLGFDYLLSASPVVTLGNGVTTGVLDLHGTTTNTLGGLSGNAGNLVTNTSPAPATLLFNGGNGTFAGTIADGPSGRTVALQLLRGTLTLSGANTYTGGTTVNAGTLVLASSAALTPGSSLTLNAGASATIANSPKGSTIVLQLGALNLAETSGGWTADLNVTNNTLIIETTDAAKPAVLTDLHDQVLYGSSNPEGITTDLHHPLIVIDNGSLANPLATFDGVPVDLDSIIITPALLGDANLDGVVDIQDLTTVANHWQQSVTDWTQGDFDSNGIVDIQDLTAVANNWQAGVGSGGGSSFTTALSDIGGFNHDAVPEPTSLTLLTLGSAAIMIRRRKTK